MSYEAIDMLRERDAEIERLKAEIKRLTELHRRAADLVWDLAGGKAEAEKLGAELADALEKWCVPMRHGESKLIQRAREAVK